jgi:hypothetical protein
MLIPYKNEESEFILREIQKSNQMDGSKSIFYINGVAGSGKSTIIEDLLNTIENQKLADFVFRMTTGAGIDYLVEFASNLASTFINFKNESVAFKARETRNNYNWLLEVFEHLKTISEVTGTENLNKVLVNSQLMSKFDEDHDEIDQEKVIPILKKEKDKNILFECERVVAESFLVDLMSQFFPVNKTTTFDDYLKNQSPLKVLIILEDYYSINKSINKFLTEVFLPIVFELSFNDFKHYKPAKNDFDLKISNFFDFKFIVSGREIIEESSLKTIDNLLNDRFYELYLEGFNNSQVEEFLASVGLNPELYIEDFEDISHGNPLICKLLFESTKKNNRIVDILQTYENLQSTIAAIYTPKQREFLKNAACFDFINSKNLRYFVERLDTKEAIRFFKNASEISNKIESDENNFVPLNIYKDCFSDLMSQHEDTRFKRLDSYSYDSNKLSPLFDKLNDFEFDVVRKLGYFTRFEPTFISNNFFKYDSDLALEVIETKKFAFYSNKFTKSVRYDYVDSLKVFNKIVDGEDKYDEINIEIKQLWDDYTFEVNSSTNLIKADVDDLTFQINEIEEEKKISVTRYEKANNRFTKNNKRIDYIKSELHPFTEKQTGKAYIVYFIGSISMFAGSFVSYSTFIPKITSDTAKALSILNDPLIVYSIITLLVGLGLASLTMSAIPVIKKIINKIKKREFDNLTLQLETAETNKLIFEEELSISTNELESVNAKLNILKKKVEKLNLELYDNKIKLQEVFLVKETKED